MHGSQFACVFFVCDLCFVLVCVCHVFVHTTLVSCQRPPVRMYVQCPNIEYGMVSREIQQGRCKAVPTTPCHYNSKLGCVEIVDQVKNKLYG